MLRSRSLDFDYSISPTYMDLRMDQSLERRFSRLSYFCKAAYSFRRAKFDQILFISRSNEESWTAYILTMDDQLVTLAPFVIFDKYIHRFNANNFAQAPWESIRELCATSQLMKQPFDNYQLTLKTSILSDANLDNLKVDAQLTQQFVQEITYYADQPVTHYRFYEPNDINNDTVGRSSIIQTFTGLITSQSWEFWSRSLPPDTRINMFLRHLCTCFEFTYTKFQTLDVELPNTTNYLNQRTDNNNNNNRTIYTPNIVDYVPRALQYHLSSSRTQDTAYVNVVLLELFLYGVLVMLGCVDKSFEIGYRLAYLKLHIRAAIIEQRNKLLNQLLDIYKIATDTTDDVRKQSVQKLSCIHAIKDVFPQANDEDGDKFGAAVFELMRRDIRDGTKFRMAKPVNIVLGLQEFSQDVYDQSRQTNSPQILTHAITGFRSWHNECFDLLRASHIDELIHDEANKTFDIIKETPLTDIQLPQDKLIQPLDACWWLTRLSPRWLDLHNIVWNVFDTYG